MKCQCCDQEKDSVRQSKLSVRILCGKCRIDEYDEMKAEYQLEVSK